MSLHSNHEELFYVSKAWEQPIIADLAIARDQTMIEKAINNGQITRIIDPVYETAEALYDYNNPSERNDLTKKNDFIGDVMALGDEYGAWVWTKWNDTLTRYPSQTDHFLLRTSRNRNLITREQQENRYNKTISVTGLSVGSWAASSLVISGIGNKYVLCDFDTFSPENGNRFFASHANVGERKDEIIAKFISEIDPWIEIKTVRDPISHANVKILEDAKPDLIVEEVDDMSAKALLRLTADKLGVPLIMAADIDKTSAIDVERYDLRDKKNIMFAGRIPKEDVRAIADAKQTFGANTKAMLKHVGVGNLTVGMLNSSMERGVSLGGLPQLGMTAIRGGANLAYAAGEIFDGHALPSGRYYDRPRVNFKQGRESSLSEYLSTLVRVSSYMKKISEKQ